MSNIVEKKEKFGENAVNLLTAIESTLTCARKKNEKLDSLIIRASGGFIGKTWDSGKSNGKQFYYMETDFEKEHAGYICDYAECVSEHFNVICFSLVVDYSVNLVIIDDDAKNFDDHEEHLRNHF